MVAESVAMTWLGAIVAGTMVGLCCRGQQQVTLAYGVTRDGGR
jgi:hypothetical protein